jgi:nucleoside phosphorylase
VAVRSTLDEEYSCHPKGHDYVYSFGKIAEHKVVIAQSQMGTIEAACCASAVSRQFPNVRLALMVGIGAGIPSPTHDIRLGDLAISIPKDGHPGVVQYDFGKYEQNNFQLKGCWLPQ